MERLKYIIVLNIILVLANTTVISQTFQDFKNQIREEYNTFENETQEKFNNFVAQIDKEFADYLSENFTTYTIGNDKFEPLAPKPNKIPIVEDVEVTGDEIEYKVVETVITYQGPVSPGIKKSESNDFEVERINIDFLGWPLYFDLDKSFFSIEIGSLNAENISSYWTNMSEINYNHFLYQISEVANILNINQWGYYQLLKECSKQVYPSNKNLQVMFQWAMLSRSRYKVKVGFNNEKAFILVPTIYSMYNIDFVVVAGANYYIIDGKGEKIETYEKDFPEADILMDVSIKKPMYTNEIKKSRDFNFTYKEKKYTVNLAYDEEMINFYKTIPLSDIVVYFNSVVSNRTKTSVIESFEPILQGKDDVESVNILLSFMQQAFGYITDKYAYGVEKYFFADELLHYPFSDCEDRSVLFAYLVKTLLNKEVLALGFPGHMATAINLNDDIEGTYLSYNNKTFIVADPTFYGAPVGILVTAVCGLKADAIPLSNSKKKAKIAEAVWEKTNEFGGLKADRLVDVVFDNYGNVYVCGYFNGSADFDGYKLTGDGDNRDVFVAKYDDNLKPIWVISGTGTGNDLAFSLALGNNNNIYVYGSVENNLNFSGVEINAIDAPDVFVANISEDGKLFWAKKAGIDKLDHSLDFIFSAKFNPQGKKIMAKLYSQTEDFTYYGLDVDDEGNAFIKGSFFATTGMNSNDYIDYNFEEDLENVPAVLYNTDKKLRGNEYEETIAGLFAALNLLKANTVEIEGSQIKTTFDKYNNNFSTYASGIYENLERMSFVKNEKGIVIIKTDNSQPVELDKIKIENDARIRIVKYKSGNILVEVLSGIYIGGGGNWLDMNSIKLFKDSGDLLFDFDTDHSVVKLNLRKEILKR